MDILLEVGVADRLGGSRMSLYLDTISTELKYTMARARNCACFVSSCKQIRPLNRAHSRTNITYLLLKMVDTRTYSLTTSTG